MEIVLTAENAQNAVKLKDAIIDSIANGTDKAFQTWSYEQSRKKSGGIYDIIFHNPSQYVKDGTKNVIFIVTTDADKVIFKNTYWVDWNIVPNDEMVCYHVGRLTEVLLANFRTYFAGFDVVDF